jgi:hypothetical protein
MDEALDKIYKENGINPKEYSVPEIIEQTPTYFILRIHKNMPGILKKLGIGYNDYFIDLKFAKGGK